MVADSDMKQYFQEHRDRFALSEEYTLSEILIQPRSPDDTADAREKVREVMARLKQGESFEDLALRFSDGPSASHGGRLGLVRQGELLPEIERYHRKPGARRHLGYDRDLRRLSHRAPGGQETQTVPPV